jgi:hypothetical protein
MISVYDIILYIILYVSWYHTLISCMISYIHMVWYWMWYQIWYHDQSFTGALRRHPPQRQPQPRWRMLCLFNFPAYMDCNVGYQIPSSQAPASPSLSTEEAETDSSAPSPSSCTVSARSAPRDRRYCRWPSRECARSTVRYTSLLFVQLANRLQLSTHASRMSYMISCMILHNMY